jgi:putative peptidoglycan lipid II flippase
VSRPGPSRSPTPTAEEAGDPPTQPAAAPRRRGGAAWYVGAGILLSRIAGLVREQATAYFLGAGATADVFKTAFRTPNFIQNLLGEGTLSASFIPIYSEMLEKGREEDAGRFAGAVLGLLSLAAFGLALIGILSAPVLVPIVFQERVPGGAGWDAAQVKLGIHLIRILFMMTAILVVSGWALGVLNSHRRFFISYVAPVAWNAAIVGALAAGAVWVGQSQEQIAVAGAWGGIVGAVFQLAVQLPMVIPVLKHFRLSVSRAVVGVQEAIRTFIPVVASRGVVNLSGYLDTILANYLAVGSAAALSYALTLFLLPISLFGMSITASELPELSRQREQAADAMWPRLEAALGRLTFLLLPSALAYLVIGDVFVSAMFQHGAFNYADTILIYATLAAFSLGLMASGRSRVLSSAFYALRDTRTPARIAYVRVAVSVVLGILLMLPLDRIRFGPEGQRHSLGAVGLALGASIGAWIEWGMLRRKIGVALGGVPQSVRRIPAGVLTAAAVATVCGAGAKLILGSLVPLRPGLLVPASGQPYWIDSILLAAGTALAFGVPYLAVASALGVGIPLRKLIRR